MAISKPQTPVLYIAGGNDKYQPTVDKFKAVLPQIKTAVIPDASHMCNLEQPEKFNQTLLEFLAEARASNPSPFTGEGRVGVSR